MKKIITVFFIMLIAVPSLAFTNIKEVLDSIAKHNTTLKALRATAQAQRLENMAGIFLPGIEVGFNYLWGSPSPTGSRKDISIQQSFDLPTITGLKSRVAKGKNSLLAWQYETDKMKILLEAKLFCLDLIYYNALLKDLGVREKQISEISAAQKKRMDKGDGNAMGYNKAMSGLYAVRAELKRVETERNAVSSQLARLNGGMPTDFCNTEYESNGMPENFESWYAAAEKKDPFLSYTRQEAELSQKSVSLSKSMSLPSFAVGYMSEDTKGQSYRGISLGLSIPIWDSKNKIRQAKAEQKAAEARSADALRQFYSQIEILYGQTSGLKATADFYRTALEKANTSALLKKALDAGEISLLDYLLEMDLFYNTLEQTLRAERDYQKALACLSAVDLL